MYHVSYAMFFGHKGHWAHSFVFRQERHSEFIRELEGYSKQVDEFQVAVANLYQWKDEGAMNRH